MDRSIDELRNEISEVEKYYRILKDYLVGAELSIVEVRGCLHSLKEYLSKVRVSLFDIMLAKIGKKVNLPIDDLLDKIDLALILIESNPQQARLIIQTALTLSSIKIEDIVASLGFLKKILSP